VKSNLSHAQLLVQSENMGFYRDLFGMLGWQTLHEGEFDGVQMLGVSGSRGERGESLWFTDQANGAANDYDGPGVNHLSVATEMQTDVDTAAAFLTERGVPLLFEPPRHRPEFAMSEGETYYQIMFESPDRILWEVVYTGPKG